MKYLIIILALFFIGCYEEEIEPSFCDTHICEGECHESLTETNIYLNDELFMIRCLKKCSWSETFFKEWDSELSTGTCTINVSDINGICEINSHEGLYCSEFFSKYEE